MSTVTPHLLRSALVAALGSFLFGFDTAVISGTTDALRLRFLLDSNQLGLHCRQRARRHHLRIDWRGQAGRAVRPPPGVPDRRRALLRVGGGLRPRVGLAVARELPLRRRPRRRGGLGRRADVHRRDLAGQPPRPAGRAQPVQRRVGDPDRLLLELRDREPRRRPASRAPGGGCSASRRCPRRCSSCSCCGSPRARAGWSSSTGTPKPQPCSARWATTSLTPWCAEIAESLHEESVSALGAALPAQVPASRSCLP